MSGCRQLMDAAGEGLAPSLRAVDCMSGQLTTAAFDRLLGAHGALLPALTVILTLYIALFALALLAGRTRLGVGMLTGRMMSIALVLGFATSWAAYQQVVWQLASAAPDQIAGVVLGEKGSATDLFAARIDTLFAAIGDISTNAQEAANQQPEPASSPPANPAPAAHAPAPAPGVSPASMVWLGATLFLLGSVGVMVTAKIILALLLALGPVFVVFALFPASRGLFAGWLRAALLAALAPLLAVVGGAFTLELAVPEVARLAGPDGIEAKSAMAFFLIAAVHACLMVMALRTAATIVGGWRVFPYRGPDDVPQRSPVMGAPATGTAPLALASGMGRHTLTTQRGAAEASADSLASRSHARVVLAGADTARLPVRGLAARPRASGIGSRFRSPPAQTRLR